MADASMRVSGGGGQSVGVCLDVQEVEDWRRQPLPVGSAFGERASRRNREHSKIFNTSTEGSANSTGRCIQSWIVAVCSGASVADPSENRVDGTDDGKAPAGDKAGGVALTPITRMICG